MRTIARWNGLPSLTALSMVLLSMAIAGAPIRAEDRPVSTPSATAPVRRLFLDPSALATWLQEHNRDLQAGLARVRQAEADAAQSRLLPNPSLTASLSDLTVGRTNPPGLGYGETSIYGGALSETLEIGKRGPRKRAASLRLESGRASFLDGLVGKMADARLILGRVAYLKARQAVLEESLSAARQIQEIQRTRVENGDLSGRDLDRLLVDTMLLDAEVARTGSEYAETVSACGALLFAPCDAPDVELSALPPAAELPETLDVETALRTRPDLVSVDRDREAADQDSILARRRRIPDPNLSVGYLHDNLTISGDQPDTLQFSVALPLPLFDRGQHDARKATEHARELAETGLAGRARARAEIEAFVGHRSFVETTLQTLQAEALPKSKSVLDATVSAVGQGEMSMTDLLLARRTHTDLLLKVMDLQFDLFSVRNELRHSLGLDAGVARAALGLKEASS